MTEVNFDDINKITTPKAEPKKSKKPVLMHRPQTYNKQEEQKENRTFEKNIPNELRGGLKTIAMLGLSFPIPENKRKHMMTNLQNSKYTNEYLDKYLCVDNIANLDDHSKFGLVYVMNVIDTIFYGSCAQSEPEPLPTDAPPMNEQKID